MKLQEIVVEATKLKLPPPDKPRPKKTLWFQDSYLWRNDLENAHPGRYKFYREENEEVAYAIDDENRCYGAWWNRKNRGVTFPMPRPAHSVVSARTKLIPFNLD